MVDRLVWLRIQGRIFSERERHGTVVANGVPMLTLVSFVVLALASGVAPATVKSIARKGIAVRVVQRCPPGANCLPLEVVQQMKDEAAGIWSSLDVRIVWIDSDDRAAAGLTSVDLRVMLEPSADGGRRRLWQDGIVLATMHQPDVPCGVGLAHIWVAHVRQHLTSIRVQGVQFASLPDALSKLLLARALGRALAHEIGHYLLSTARHTPYGLMRAHFTPQEMLEPPTEARYGLDRLDRGALSACGSDLAALP
jgi:hypothetical protein